MNITIGIPAGEWRMWRMVINGVPCYVSAIRYFEEISPNEYEVKYQIVEVPLADGIQRVLFSSGGPFIPWSVKAA